MNRMTRNSIPSSKFPGLDIDYVVPAKRNPQISQYIYNQLQPILLKESNFLLKDVAIHL